MKKALLLIKKILTSPRAFVIYLVHCLKQYRYNDLLQFAGEENTDKGFPGHNYVRIYDHFLRSKRSEALHLCEIGLLRGRWRKPSPDDLHPDAPSLNLWRKYLPNAHLVGFDVRAFKQSQDVECTIIRGDQSSRKDLQKIIDHHSEYDVIIDDALHASPHQQITLSFLFPYLKSGGIFFIEDLRSQPKEFERDYVPKTLDLLKKFVATGVWSSPLATPEEKRILEREVQDVHLFESLKGANPIFGAGAIAVIIKK